MEKEIEIIYENTEQNIDVINDALEIGIIPQGTLSITENGEYDVTNYETADVNTPGIVPTGTLNVTENGDYDITSYSGVSVTVPGIVPTGSLNITSNGSHDVTTYATANVNVVAKYAPTFIRFVQYTGNDLTYETSNLDTSNITSFDSMFTNCSNLLSLDLSNFNTSNGTSFKSMFTSCSSIASINVTGWNMSNATNLYHMFMQCPQLTELNLSSWDTRNVTDFSAMFDSCSSLTTLNVNFNVSKASTVNGMFGGCSGLTTLDLSNWEFRENNCQTGMLFYNCRNLTHIDFRNATFSRTYGSNMFGSNASSGVPDDCEIIVKDNTQKTWFTRNVPRLTNVKTVAEYEGE